MSTAFCGALRRMYALRLHGKSLFPPRAKALSAKKHDIAQNR